MLYPEKDWPQNEDKINERCASLVLTQTELYDPLQELHKALHSFRDMVSRKALQDIKALADGFQVYPLYESLCERQKSDSGLALLDQKSIYSSEISKALSNAHVTPAILAKILEREGDHHTGRKSTLIDATKAIIEFSQSGTYPCLIFLRSPPCSLRFVQQTS